ncbi:MAG: hypothetical protein PHX78_11685 [bacterium]|nr:hypothetical protein [bacterium]
MNSKKLYIQVSLFSGRSYIGYVSNDFSPNYSDDLCFTLHDVHFLYTKSEKNGEPALSLISIQDTPEGLLPDIDIMWQAVNTIQYLNEDSKIIREIETRKSPKTVKKENAEIYILKKTKKDVEKKNE